MPSRTFLFSPIRALLGHIRCYSVAGSLEIRSVSWISQNVSPFSSSCTLHDSPNKPGKSGDKGPAKNYKKKMLKKQRKTMGALVGGAKLDALMEGVKAIESLTSLDAQPPGHIASLMSSRGRMGDRSRINKKQVKIVKVTSGPEFDAITDGIKTIESLMASEEQGLPAFTSPMRERWKRRGATGSSTSRKQQEKGEEFYSDEHYESRVQSSPKATGGVYHRKVAHAIDSRLPKLRGKGEKSELNFTDPSSGERLGLFHHPKPGTKIMPRSKPTLAEQDELRGLQELFLLKPTSHYEEQMEDAMTTTVQYPRAFPIDNDDYYRDHEEAGVGFEEHVLLDHLLAEGFPKKGPVRHFMELVVTGLSKNPHYTASEKRQCVQWYKDYFSEFTSKELQSL